MNLKNRKILAVCAIFVAFSAMTLWVSSMAEARYKRAILSSRLEAYADLVARRDSTLSDSLVAGFPKGLRLTILDLSGSVLYDSVEDSLEENHLQRPEIRACLGKGEGSAIRLSASSGEKYFYYAKLYEGQIIRTAQLFEVDLERFFKADYLLILCFFFLIALFLLLVIYVSERYERKEQILEDRKTRELKHEMTSNISHELKTPASSIQGYLQTLLEHPDLPEDKKQKFLERTYRQSLRLSELIKDISLITKLEEVPDQFKREPVNIKVLFGEVCEEFAKELQEKGISVSSELPPICIKANYILLYSIFRNLLENTIKYSGGNCSATISYSESEDESNTHSFNYSDTGRGVPEAELDKIFTRFYRLDKDRANADSGSGLGLAIVRNAVLFHHGQIRAYRGNSSVSPDSASGLGFRFTIKEA